ncbi:MAG TPA: PAS domain S-box protein, partial [Verrucomicrobium sp.]|nr:PAS domain S-box protein [Verrucomicrobium sp.]
QLQNALTDGSWFNLAFSAANLALGYGAMQWRVQGLTDHRLDRSCETVLRMLPLVLVMLAVISVVLGESIHHLSPVVQGAINVAAVLAVVLIIWRQNVMLSERDRRLAVEQKMRESEGRYQSLFESSLDGIFIQMGIKFVDCNERALQLLNCTRDQIIGKSTLDISPERQPDGRTSREAAGRQLTEVLEGRRQAFNWLVQRPDGSTFDAEVSMGGMKVGERLVVQTVMRDISERKRAEDALKTSEARFSSSFASAAIGMALVGTDGQFLKVNAALCAMLGYSDEELITKTFQEITHPEDLEADMDLLRKTLAGLTDSYQIEKRYIHRNGALVSILLSVSLVRDVKGCPLHFTAQIQDVTQRKKLEEQFRQSQKMEAVGQLAGGVAHDFNNILTVIQGYATLLQTGEIPLHTGIKEISISVERASSLTRQLLTFSRKQIMQPRELDMNVVVENMITMLRRTLGEHVTLTVKGPHTLPHVHADKGMMEQILLNLAVNSRDAMPKGGQLTITTSPTFITEEEARQNPDARVGAAVGLTVEDTGCGIPQENLARIFEPFFTTKDVNSGTGLGLATVHGIVRQHRGLVRVSSEVGVGTQFLILLPACPTTFKSQPKPPEAEPKATGGHETILLVDDEPALRMVSKMTLKHYGYHVLEAGSGPQALKLVEEHPEHIDLLLTDMVMPEGLSGKDLADLLRNARPDIRVLFTSGYSVELLNRTSSLSEDVWFLPKPFTTQKLAHMVRECLNAPAGGKDM